MPHDHGKMRVASASLALYALAHCAVDASCVGLLWTAYTAHSMSPGSAWAVFFSYNFLAFALQPLAGLAVDRTRAARGAAIAGAAMVVLAWAAFALPGAFVVALALMGLGNAVFHVGGGVVSLLSTPAIRATPVALFVAPGAAGVLAGTLAGRAGGAWIAAVALAVLTALVALLPAPRFSTRGAGRAGLVPARPAGGDRAATSAGLPPALATIILLLLLVVAVRSYVGLALAFPWKSGPAMVALFTLAVVAGKAVGGFAADRLGWRAAGVGALLVSIPLLALGHGSAALGLLGVLAFNMTMPVTLVAVALALPGHEGLAFGLTCLALFAGSVPVLADWITPIQLPVLAILGGAAAAALWIGLGRLVPGRSARPSHTLITTPQEGEPS
jgi:FSR family fosmidomycin resistance protein-like MFS transporter